MWCLLGKRYGGWWFCWLLYPQLVTAQKPLTPPNKLTIWLLGKSHPLGLMTRFWALKFLCQPWDNLPSTVPAMEDGLGVFHSYSLMVVLALAYYSLKVKTVSLSMDKQQPDNQSFPSGHIFSLLCYLFGFHPMVWGKRWVIFWLYFDKRVPGRLHAHPNSLFPSQDLKAYLLSYVISEGGRILSLGNDWKESHWSISFFKHNLGNRTCLPHSQFQHGPCGMHLTTSLSSEKAIVRFETFLQQPPSMQTVELFQPFCLLIFQIVSPFLFLCLVLFQSAWIFNLATTDGFCHEKVSCLKCSK